MEADRGTEVEERLIGEVAGPDGGPTLLCVAGIYGNKPDGVHAVGRVLASLERRRDDLECSLVALAGNMAALEAGHRFVDRDLNRAWTWDCLEQLHRDGVAGASVENVEQVELLKEIEHVLRDARGPAYALDLHTTSGPGGVFSAFTDSLPLRALAANFPIPMIFGLEELVDGTLLNLLSENGIVALTVETGQHDEPEAIDRAEAALWIAIVSAGLLPERLVPEATEARKRLRRDAGDLPRALEMRYKRGFVDGDGFELKPGYLNFQSVRAGDIVADDIRGAVTVSEDGRLLMPLYQEQGEDGFFLVREFPAFWMGVSHVMRRVGFSRVAFWLPGVVRVAGLRDEVVVNKRVARFFARQLFHLLGFRQLEDVGSSLRMRRRHFDEGRYRSEPPARTSPETPPGAD